MKGKAVVFNGENKSWKINEFPVVSPNAGQVSLSLERSGICGTDVHILQGKLPMPPQDMIIGHEFCGKILELGENVSMDGLGNAIKTGDLAIACVAIPCKNCFNCRSGETASCLNFGVTYVASPEESPHFFGGFSEYLFSPSKNLIKIPENIDLDAVAALPCAGPTVIRAFTYGGGLNSGELVVVQGGGSLGLFATAWAVKSGCEVIFIGSSSNPARLDLAEKLGAKLILDYRADSPQERAEKVKDFAANLNRGDGADVVIECSGEPASFAEGLALVRTRGRYLVPGQYSVAGGVNINPEQITFRALRIIGSGQYQLEDIASYLNFLQKNPDTAAILAKCITHRYKIDEAAKAFENATAGRSIKGVFQK